MFYTPRFSSSVGRPSGSDVSRPHLVESPGATVLGSSPAPTAAAASPRHGGPPRCWLCDAPCASAGYRAAPALFFPALAPRPQPASALRLGSGLTLCPECHDGRTPSSSSPTAPTAAAATHTRTFVERVRSYHALLHRTAAKVVEASRQFCDSADGAQPLLLRVDDDTTLAEAPPQLQRKVLRVLLSHLDEAAASDFSSGAAGQKIMTQAERNVFLREMVHIDRALGALEQHGAAVAGGQAPDRAEGTAHSGPRYTGDDLAAAFSSRPPQPQEQQQQQQCESQTPYARRGGSCGNSSSGAAAPIHGAVESAMWRAARVDPATNRHTPPVQQNNSTAATAAGVALNGGGAARGSGEDVLQQYFARRLRSPSPPIGGYSSPSPTSSPPNGATSSPGHPPGQRRSSGSPRYSPARSHPHRSSSPGTRAALVEEAQEPTAGPNAVAVAGAAERLAVEVARRRDAEGALLDAHQHIAALEQATDVMSEKLFSRSLAFVAAAHLERLDTVVFNMVTLTNMYTLRKSMLFAEEVATATRAWGRQAIRAVAAATTQQQQQQLQLHMGQRWAPSTTAAAGCNGGRQLNGSAQEDSDSSAGVASAVEVGNPIDDGPRTGVVTRL